MYIENNFFKKAVTNCIKLKLDNVELPVLKPEDLIILKKQSDRAQDKIDIDVIIDELGDELDLDYINNNKNIGPV